MTKPRGVLVTGAAGRIGAAIARQFAASGDGVLATDLDEAGLDVTVRNIQEHDGQATAIAADVGSEDAVERLVATGRDTVGTIEVLVNCAGVFPNTPVVEMATEEWDRVFGVNLRGPFLLSRAVARQMVAENIAGSIVNISSSAGVSGRTGGSHYCGSKAALNMLTKIMAIELGPHGIRVNGVAPGLVLDEVLSRPVPEDTHPYVESLLSGIPLGRTGHPDEIADAVLFLCSTQASWISGEIIGVNGGSMAGRTHLPPSAQR